MNVRSFYGSSKRIRIPPRATVFPINQPELSELSDLSSDSDECFTTSDSGSEYVDSESDSDSSVDSTGIEDQQKAPQQPPTEQIKSKFHCNDDLQCPECCTDKLYKIRPIIKMLKESFTNLKHEELLCIDEQVVVL